MTDNASVMACIAGRSTSKTVQVAEVWMGSVVHQVDTFDASNCSAYEQ